MRFARFAKEEGQVHGEPGIPNGPCRRPLLFEPIAGLIAVRRMDPAPLGPRSDGCSPLSPVPLSFSMAQIAGRHAARGAG